MKVSINAKTIRQVVTAENAQVIDQRSEITAHPGDLSAADRRVISITDTTVVPSFEPQPRQADDPRGMASTARDKLFVSYSHKDIDWLRKFQTIMSPLLSGGALSVWWDGEICPADRWKSEIDLALASTKVALLMVSPNFLASDFIMSHELPYLLAAADRQEIRLTWILVRTCLYHRTRLHEFQAVHDVSRPLSKLTDAEQDDVLVAICQLLEETLRRP
jgi:hypothetical protein